MIIASHAEVVERQTRMLQAHVPIGCEGSNPFLRIIKELNLVVQLCFFTIPLLSDYPPTGQNLQWRGLPRE